MKASTRAREKRGTTWPTLSSWAAATLPGIEQGLCYGTPALYVRKRILARLRPGEETVAVKVEFLDRDVLLEADPEAFFLTDHYRPYPMVVMRLAKAVPCVAKRLLEEAWLRAAPKSLIEQRTSTGVGRSAKPARKRPRTSGGTRQRLRRG